MSEDNRVRWTGKQCYYRLSNFTRTWLADVIEVHFIGDLFPSWIVLLPGGVSKRPISTLQDARCIAEGAARSAGYVVVGDP